MLSILPNDKWAVKRCYMVTISLCVAIFASYTTAATRGEFWPRSRRTSGAILTNCRRSLKRMRACPVGGLCLRMCGCTLWHHAQRLWPSGWCRAFVPPKTLVPSLKGYSQVSTEYMYGCRDFYVQCVHVLSIMRFIHHPSCFTFHQAWGASGSYLALHH